MKHLLLVVMLTVASALLGQDTIPAGTILPLQLNSSLKSDKAYPGQTIRARLMQDVPLPDGSKIHSGAKVVGEVVSARKRNDGNPAKLVLRFDALIVGSHRISITTNFRALASMMDVNDAQVPATGPDRGTSEFTWNTAQIGGETNYHGSSIYQGAQVVGKSIPPTGALVQVSAKQGMSCRADVGENNLEQATWVFASNACGLYGYPDLTVAHAGRTTPVGEIMLVSNNRNLIVQGGSGILLRVD
jgi:hypothetical protein